MTKSNQWMRFKAEYTVWNGGSIPREFEAVEISLTSFTERLEREVEKKGDIIKTISVENLGCE